MCWSMINWTSLCSAHIISFPALTLAVGDLGLIIYISRTCILLQLTACDLFQFTEDLGVQLVIVNIADENDNGPLFTKKLYTGGNLFLFLFMLNLTLIFFANFTLSTLFTPKSSLLWQKILYYLRDQIRRFVKSVHFDQKAQLAVRALRIFRCCLKFLI